MSLDTKGKQKGTKYSKSPNHVWTTNQTLIYGRLTWKYYIIHGQPSYWTAHTTQKYKKMAGKSKFPIILLNDANMIKEH